MSKFIEKLEKVGQQAPNPMGFGAAARQGESNPQILLVGSVNRKDLAQNSKLADAKVDAILVELDAADEPAVKKVADALKDRLWGVKAPQVSEEQAADLKEQGCDFVVFGAEGTTASVLNDEDIGKVMDLGAGVDEDTARALHDLSIDAVFFSPEGDLHPLTVEKMLRIQKMVGLLGRPFIVSVPSAYGAGELEVFRNAGIECLMLALSSADDIARIKDAIDSLPRRKNRSDGRRMAVIPHPRMDTEPPEMGDDDDDDF